MRELTAYAVVALLLVATGGAVASYEQVGEGHVGVEKEWGAVTGNTHEPGANWIAPWKGVQRVEVRPRTYTMSDTSGEGEKEARRDSVVVQTINGTTVRVDVTVRYRVDPDRADDFVRQWRNVEQAEERLIRPTVRSKLRDEAAAVPTTDIYTAGGRERLAAAATVALEQEFAGEALVLETVQVRAVDLPAEYDKALDAKEVAKQRVQEKEYEVQQERKEAERKRIEAEANADVIEIEGGALRDNPEVLIQQQIAAQENANTIYVPVGDDGLPMYLDAENESEGGDS
jgi:regulator of protease activity HflC (stomatin/prohibitin superfamily)